MLHVDSSKAYQAHVSAEYHAHFNIHQPPKPKIVTEMGWFREYIWNLTISTNLEPILSKVVAKKSMIFHVVESLITGKYNKNEGERNPFQPYKVNIFLFRIKIRMRTRKK